MKNIHIFLDDERDPEGAIRYVGTLPENYIDKDQVWTIVRDVEEFKALVDKTIADGDRIATITFDHDLGTDPYTGMIKPNGQEAAKYILDLIFDRVIDYVPRANVHSANPIGAKNIWGYIADWKKIL